MDKGNQFDIQRQIRNNAEDLHRCSRDLKHWEAEMKRKDLELSEQLSKKDIPPIRKKCKTDPSGSSEEKPNRISAFDYSAWDKFDVDKACDELDKQDSDEDEESDIEEEEDLDRIATAVYNKEQGNTLVKQGKWGEAIEKYNVAIQTYPNDAVFFANRALCFLKMKNFVSAEADCTCSIRLDNTYVKAYQRRAAARRALNQFEEARKDTLKVLTLEPNNKQAEIELEELNRKLNIPSKTADKSCSKSSNTSPTDSKSLKEKSNLSTKQISSNKQPLITPLDTVYPSSTSPPDLSWVPLYDTTLYSVVPKQQIPPHKRSKKSLIKINIEAQTILDHNKPLSHSSTTLIEEKTRKLSINNDVEMEEVVRRVKEEPNKTSDDKQGEEFEISDSISEAEQRRKKLEMLESAWNELQNANPYKKSTTDEDKAKENGALVEEKETNEAAAAASQVKSQIPGPPKTCSQFELHWRTLKSSEDNLYLYLKQIEGQELPNIFQEGLDSFTFTDIVQCLNVKFIENKENIAHYIQGLAKTPRLGSLVMFMTQAEKSQLSKLLKYCEDENQLNTNELSQLKRTFEL
uniref:RNA polymerase II-associated protein 3 n=1 Tax=Cacopsylla melanoneura TaxID=428564 RepID=A0A8D8QR02_9HEMI